MVSEALAEQVTGFHVHRGALASLHREERHTIAQLLSLARLVVLEDIVDHTNVGAILRNAAGLGWDGALISPRTADPLYRRSIKVSMGAVFALPWARLGDWHGAPDLLTTAGFRTVALTLAEDAVNLAEVAGELASAAKVAVLLGTEGAGLSRRWTEGAAVRVRIPMSAGVDSLNVAAAAAIACYSMLVDLRSSVCNPGRHRPVVRVGVGDVLVQAVQLLACPAGEPVAEHGAVEVVGLMLEATGQQAGAGDLDRVPVLVLPATGGVVGPSQLDVGAREARHPSSLVSRLRSLPSGRVTSGLQNTPTWRTWSSSGQSYTNTARSTPTWLAARPTPSAAYMVANRSRTSSSNAESNSVTLRVG